MEAQKNWNLILSEIESSISITESLKGYKVLLNQFESIDEDYRDQNAPKHYGTMWRIALRLGKLSQATLYAKKFAQYLIDHKRIPHLKIFIKSLSEAGLLKKNIPDYLAIQEILLGKIKNVTQKELNHFEYFSHHPEHWKKTSAFLKQYLLMDEDWNIEQWTLSYEYILLNQFDKDIFKIILTKARESKNKSVEKKLVELFHSKNIKIESFKSNEKNAAKASIEKLNIDYDQLAMEVLSGSKNPDSEEQRRVLNSLKFISESELLSKGQDMVIAFELLGMEQVVLALCEKIIKIQGDIKKRASTYFMWVQALSNIEEFYQAIDLINEVLDKEPLLNEERMAFLYLKAEAFLKLKNMKAAKVLYLEIKKQNPHYRLVGERLKTIEAS